MSRIQTKIILYYIILYTAGLQQRGVLEQLPAAAEQCPRAGPAGPAGPAQPGLGALHAAADRRHLRVCVCVCARARARTFAFCVYVRALACACVRLRAPACASAYVRVCAYSSPHRPNPHTARAREGVSPLAFP